MRILKRVDRERQLAGNFFAAVWLPLAICLFVVGFAVRSLAQNEGVVGMFPDPSKVTADYPDDAERYTAFSTLYDALMADMPKPASKVAYEKSSAYMASYNGIDSSHMQQGMPAYRPWAAQRDKTLDDPAFRRSVLEKYQLASLSPIARVSPQATVNPSSFAYQPSSGQVPFAQPNGNPQTYDQSSPGERLNRLCVRAFPVMAISLVAMIWLPWWLMGHSGIKQKVPGQLADGSLSSLPESLQVIHLPGVRYPVTTISGLVLDKETMVHTSSSTTTTPSQVNVVGSTVHVTPGQTYTHTTRRRSDALRMRTLDGREASWTLTDQSGANIFTGQIISAVARPTKDDFSEFLLAYNHNTGELSPVEAGLDNAHAARGFLAFVAQPVSTLAGSVGFGILVAYFLTSGIGNLVNVGGVDFFIGLWVVGGLCSLTVAFFLTHWLRWKIAQRRNKRFVAQYGPQFRQFFEQSTPALQKRFATP
jgi:hypothetical protein